MSSVYDRARGEILIDDIVSGRAARDKERAFLEAQRALDADCASGRQHGQGDIVAAALKTLADRRPRRR